MRRIVFAIMFLSVVMLQNAMAQTSDMRRNIGLDSLMVIFQQHSPQKVYYISDDATKNFTFTINAASRQIKSDILYTRTPYYKYQPLCIRDTVPFFLKSLLDI